MRDAESQPPGGFKHTLGSLERRNGLYMINSLIFFTSLLLPLLLRLPVQI